MTFSSSLLEAYSDPSLLSEDIRSFFRLTNDLRLFITLQPEVPGSVFAMCLVRGIYKQE